MNKIRTLSSHQPSQESRARRQLGKLRSNLAGMPGATQALQTRTKLDANPLGNHALRELTRAGQHDSRCVPALVECLQDVQERSLGTAEPSNVGDEEHPPLAARRFAPLPEGDAPRDLVIGRAHGITPFTAARRACKYSSIFDCASRSSSDNGVLQECHGLSYTSLPGGSVLRVDIS